MTWPEAVFYSVVVVGAVVVISQFIGEAAEVARQWARARRR